MKQLLLMRHAKSSWTDPNVADIDRPLTARGRKAATRIAKYLEDSSLEPAIVLCTSAVRARQTLELLRPAIPESSTVKIESRLYSAGSKELMTRVRRLSQTAPSVLIIGHNPAIQDLVLTLASEDPRSFEIRKKFPTAALALFDAPIKEWKLFRPGEASLVHFVTPKGLRG